MSGLWREIYDAIEIVPGDRFFFPFSFGPFLAFWAAFEGAIDTGHFSLAGGGLTTHARLEAILDHRMTVVATTPTYALGMLDAAQRAGLDLAGSAVRLLLLAGEPGANIPSIRQQLEAGWGARVIDHSGMTEVGSLGIEFYSLPGKLFLIEEHCIAEFLEPGDDRPVPEGEVGELVLTNLGRWDSPLIRYRTGDIVRWRADVAPAGKPYVYLDGGIVGRADDMLYIKGNNVYPSAVESVIRSVGDIAEFAIDVDESVQPARIHITIEPLPDASVDLPHRLERAFQNQLHFRPDIQFVAAGTLPRFELKAQRVRRKR
jgi:phenylacetate-CoA ligase